jgi:hypothetical protein
MKTTKAKTLFLFNLYIVERIFKMQHITIFYGFNIDLSKFEKYQGQAIYLTMVDLDTEYKDASGQMQYLTVSEMILNFDADI